MKKLFVALCSLLFVGESMAESENLYKPTEKEIEVVKLIIKDDIEAFFYSNDGYFSYGEYQRVNAESIQKEYDENEVRADKKFKNKELIISGVVAKIQSGLGDEPFVLFKTKKMFGAPQATFLKSELDKVIDLNKGQKVVFVCVGQGEVAGTPMLRNCRFVDSVIDKLNDKNQQSYIDIQQGKIDKGNTVNQLVVMVSMLQTISNDFDKCASGKIDDKCIDKSLSNTKKAQLSPEQKDKLKALADYLGADIQKVFK